MATHEVRIGLIEKLLYGCPEKQTKSLKKQVEENTTGFIKLNAKMNAILWMFGLLNGLGITGLVLYLR